MENMFFVVYNQAVNYGVTVSHDHHNLELLNLKR